MAQFDVYELRGGRLLIDLQSDLLDIGTRVVAPLRPLGDGPRPLSRLEPIIDLNGESYVVGVGDLAAVPLVVLNARVVANLKGRDYEIRGALDMVFSGF